MMASSMKKLIIEELASILQTLDWVRIVNYEVIRLGFDGFLAHELPAIQIIDQTNIREPENQRDMNTWIVILQVIMKSQVKDQVNQSILFDRMDDIIRLIGNNTQLDITPEEQGDSFLQIRPIAEATDLHSEQPFYIAEMNLEVKFHTGTRGGCF
jgi:hypothetical protein